MRFAGSGTSVNRDPMSVFFSILGDLAGSVFQILQGIVLMLAVIAWQVYEQRRFWRSTRRTWWLVKLLAPVSVVVIVFLGLHAARDTSGFAGLAVLYLGGLIALIVGPLAVALALRGLQASSFSQALIAGVSMVALLVVTWFSVHGIRNGVTGVVRTLTNIDELVAYRRFEHAADNPSPAAASVSLVETQTFQLPDGRQLVHLAYAVDPNFELYRLRLRVTKPGGRTPWTSTLGHCLSPGEFHLMTVLDQAEWIELRVAWHRGTAASMVGVEERFEFPRQERTELPLLKVDVKRRSIEAPIPFPEEFLAIQPQQGAPENYPYLTYSREFGDGPFSNTCLKTPLTVDFDLAGVRVTLYSEEEYEHLHYDYWRSD